MHSQEYEVLLMGLAAGDAILTWQPRVAEAAPTLPGPWWQWREPRLHLTRPTWFEADHIPWAREQGCRRSLYLRLYGDAVVMAP